MVLHVTLVNYGGPVHGVTTQGVIDGRPYTMTSFVHDGVDGHERLQPGEQCTCGVLGLGVIS